VKSIRDSFVGAEFLYTHGSCYQFYLILKSIIPNAEAYYDSDHVITKIGERFYDITGEVEGCRSNYLSVDQHYHHDILRKLKFRIKIVDTGVLKKAVKESKKINS
jgi:hypothetical protein